MPHSIELVSAGLFALLGASLIMVGITRWTRASLPGPPAAGPAPAVFLFEGGALVDASPAARGFLHGPSRDLSDLGALLALLSRGFGADLPGRVAGLPPAGRFLLPSPRGGDTLEAAREDGRLRLTLRIGQDGGPVLERLLLESASEELARLRGIAEDAPQAIWVRDEEGQVVWANQSYLDLVDRTRGAPGARAEAAPSTGPRWPAAPLFAPPSDRPGERLLQRRETLVVPGRDEPMWFEVTTLQRGSGTLNIAADVGGLVLAESARLHFVQALAKTFAHLSTGLAIFDRERRLVLFNPAFVDMTGLPVTLLSGRPLVHTVLDHLREAKVLPEPSHYESWREEVAALEAAAAEDHYADTWTLPSGRTYRVTGRPHPDGALAFLFEDISDELGETRRFRAELDTAQAALDALPEALAVFAATGALVRSNAAYRELWGPPGADLPGEVDRWEALCAPSPLWTRLRADGGSGQHEATLHRRDGGEWAMRTSSLPHGATLLTFRGPGTTTDREAPETGFLPPPGAPSGHRPPGPSSLAELVPADGT